MNRITNCGENSVLKICSTICLMLLFMVVAIVPVEAASRQWSTSGTGRNVAVADCNNCDEDIGILISCASSGQGAEALVYWVASEKGQENTIAPIKISIDGKSFNRQAKVQYSGLVGYTPQFMLSSDDPMFEALQAGAAVKISFGDNSVSIPLNGSRVALNKFKVQCGLAY